MSFYIYYGKLDNELLVAVLPNGTVEHDDPIHLFLNKRFSTYRVKDISIDEDGEDSFAFNDGFYTYKAVSRKAHRELDLTIQGSGSKASKVALTRHYDQPLTAVPSSNSPKIWSGIFNFHEWAKNEPFIAIAPKGLGNGNPIISLWQWTQDAKGIANTFSASVSHQRSDSTTPTTFSFEQNGYYTVNCKVNEKTKGLNVTVKAPTNPEVIQDEFALSAEVKTGAEHTFAPPRAPQQKFTLDCSLPRAAPSLTRFSGALPFPADLVATLEYSAAYVDQAGYLAKYAVRQFDQLDRSYHQLEKKSEARSARNLKLEVEIATLKEAEAVSKKQNAELQKLLDASRTASAAQDAELKKALATLAASEALARRYETHIAADKIADMKRDKEYQAHVNADHKAIDQLQCKLSDAQEAGRRLQKDLDGKVKIIAARDASLALLGKQLADAKVDINKLKKELAIQCDARTALETEVEDLNYHLSRTREESEASKTKLAENGARIERLKADLQREETKFKACYDDLTATQKEARSDEAEHEKKVADLEVKLAKALAHEETHHILKSKTGITVTAKSVPSEC